MEQGLAYQLALMTKPRERSPVDIVTGGAYGFRYNSSQPKGEGWLGNVGTKDIPVTEYSTAYKGREVPLIVPGLTGEQLGRVVKEATTGNREDLSDVEGLARKWADDRAKLGYRPFRD
mgnify:CR=1 FL=1